MRTSRRRRVSVAILTLFLLFGTLAAASAQEPPAPELELAGQPEVSERVTGGKASSSALAQTDPALLARSDAGLVNVVIKLDYDASASYTGNIEGLAATSPSVTGRPLTGKSTAEREYDSFAAAKEADAVDALQRSVPSADVGRSLRVVYGGVAAVIPANTVEDVLAIPGVVAVQVDTLNQPLTDSSPDFLSAGPVYEDLGGTANAGEGIIYGNLDTGVWPEHPSFADQGNLGAPPPTPGGTARACNFGDNPLTPANDPFVCNNKLIGGQPFLATYLSDPGRAAAEPYHTARDSNGHGTHTSSTTAGNMLDSAMIFGVERGPIHGIAPGAHLIEYKVCGIEGCFDSDTAAAVQQAILDGVDVINFSISGGTDPFTDPTELAFLDAYAAGVFVSASAGNEGPGAGTANHLSPWVTTVGASTQTREFQSTLTVNGTSDTAVFTGASITAGAGPLPIVLSSAAPYSNALCDAPAPPGTFTGMIVACERGVVARVEKGFNVLQGGAAGMVLYNPTLADVETDNHWLPTVHLADGTDLVAFLNANPGATATFTGGVATDGQGDVMAAFSSRGPGGLFIKPDVTAPGVQILAGHSPTPESVLEGPPGQFFQAIAGTSMSSPHNAGAAILMMASHPDWTPGQVKSALMTTATEDVVKEDLVTPADPLDFGSGRIVIDTAAAAGLTLDETAANFTAMAADPLTAIHLNIPSINAPLLPGSVTTTRTFTNTSHGTVRYAFDTEAPTGTTITVSPSRIAVPAGQSRSAEITINTTQTSGTFFGAINLVPQGGEVPMHLPVAFTAGQGDVSLTSACDAASIPRNTTTTCDVTATNNGAVEATVDLTTTVSTNLGITGVTGADQVNSRTVELEDVVLAGAAPGVPSVDPGPSVAGFLPLSLFGVTPIAIGDEDIINFSVPAFEYNGETYTTLGVDSNGYSIAGGGSSEDNNCCNLPTGPDPAPPNNMLAPFWTDLDGTGADGIFIAVLTDGVNDWIVVEHQVNVFGTTSNRHFQVWIGVNGVQDITFAYDPAALPADPAGQDFLVGAENVDGEGDVSSFLPTEDQVVTSSDPTPGGVATYELTVIGRRVGTGSVTTNMTASTVPGVTTVSVPLTVS
jgi:hypothetical protein